MENEDNELTDKSAPIVKKIGRLEGTEARQAHHEKLLKAYAKAKEEHRDAIEYR